MQISSKEIIFLIGLTSLIFLIAPLFLILYVLSYNRRKKKHKEETVSLQAAFSNELLKTQMEVQEQTLKTVAHNLHDNIGQLLSLITITLSSINLQDVEKAAEKITAVDDLSKRSIKEIKALSRLLHGEELIGGGLSTAMEAELEWLQRTGRFEITFEKHADICFEADTGKDIIVFRLFQEIINNIIQHAQATKILITLEKAGDDFRITIQDNGTGFDVDTTFTNKTGMGLHNITRRSAMINGTASISSSAGKGTVITLNIPCK